VNTYPRLLAYAALVIALSFVAFFASRSRFPHNRYYIDAAERMINPGCAEIHCFRVLVPWTIGALPGKGKTALGVQVVLANGAAGTPTYAFSLEMQDVEIGKPIPETSEALLEKLSEIQDRMVEWRESAARVGADEALC
jgi:hypothetical protein